jgi:hypothetical protein
MNNNLVLYLRGDKAKECPDAPGRNKNPVETGRLRDQNVPLFGEN